MVCVSFSCQLHQTSHIWHLSCHCLFKAIIHSHEKTAKMTCFDKAMEPRCIDKRGWGSKLENISPVSFLHGNAELLDTQVHIICDGLLRVHARVNTHHLGDFSNGSVGSEPQGVHTPGASHSKCENSCRCTLQQVHIQWRFALVRGVLLYLEKSNFRAQHVYISLDYAHCCYMLINSQNFMNCLSDRNLPQLNTKEPTVLRHPSFYPFSHFGIFLDQDLKPFI